MARYKDHNKDQKKLIPVSYADQIHEGTFEYSLDYVIDNLIDLTVFDGHYQNDETGAPAYAPSVLLKIILYAYSLGINTSRDIERLCRTDVICMALSADNQPHFTTIADFISRMDDEIADVFRDVLWACDQLGLIGKQMFAIDGCKLPTNASKSHSGTKEELQRKRKKMEKAVRRMLKKHREMDEHELPVDLLAREKQQIETLRNQIKKLKQWDKENDEKIGARGKPIKSNITDNDSAKMKTSRGVIQGFIGVAAVDSKHQVIVSAEAFGAAQEHQLLTPMVECIRGNFKAIGKEKNIYKKAILTADSGFHTESNMEYLSKNKIDAYIADNQFRKRDPRFQDADKYRERHRQERRDFNNTKLRFTPDDFTHDPVNRTCICPAGKSLYRSGKSIEQNGFISERYKAPKNACINCSLRSKCLRKPEATEIRQVAFFTGKTEKQTESFSAKMKQKIDSWKGRLIYSQRLGTVEPVFGNINYNKHLDRFTLRGKRKVNNQWLLYCLVHNIEKMHRIGWKYG